MFEKLFSYFRKEEAPVHTVSHKEAERELCRIALNVRDISALKDEVGTVPIEARSDYLKEAYTLYHSKPFKDVMERLIYDQSRYGLEKIETTNQLTFVRGTLNGLCLVEEAFQSLAVEHEQLERDRLQKDDVHEIVRKLEIN